MTIVETGQRLLDTVASGRGPNPSPPLKTGKCPSEASRLWLKAAFLARRRLGPALAAARRTLSPPLLGSLLAYARARAEVAAAVRGGLVARNASAPRDAATPDAITPADVPSLAGGFSAEADDRVLAEIDQDGFAFAVDERDRSLFPGRETNVRRTRYRLDVVLSGGRIVVRKQFVPPPSSAGIREWLWGRLGRGFYNEAAALLRLDDVPGVPKVRRLDATTYSVYTDYVHGDNFKQLAASNGVRIDDLHVDAARAQSTATTPEEQRRRQIAACSPVVEPRRRAVRALVAEMARRGVYPFDVKPGNLIAGRSAGGVYWIDFERAYLAKRAGRPSPEKLDDYYRLLNEWFGLGMITRSDVRTYAETFKLYSPVDLGPLGYFGDLSDVQAGEGRWRWLLRDMTDWRGKRVLDLGTNNCLYGMREALAGAAEVHCVERDSEPVRQAEFIKRALEQVEGRPLGVTVQHTDILSFLRAQEFGPDHFDVTTALCSIYYLSREDIAESLRIVAHVSRECWLQGNVWTQRSDPKVAEFSRPEFLAAQLREAGFHDVTLVWPRGYRRPLLIGRKH